MSAIGDPISLERNPSVQMAQRRVFTVVSVVRVLRIEWEDPVFPLDRLLTGPRQFQFPRTSVLRRALVDFAGAGSPANRSDNASSRANRGGERRL